MSKNISQIPYREITERVRELARTPENTDEKVRGVIQDVFTREIPSKYDWTFLLASSGITTIDEYKTGNVSINTGSRSANFSSDVTLTAGMVGRKIKVSGNDTLYEITSFGGVTSATLLPSYEGETNASNQSYTIFQPIYALASDFDRFPKDGGIYKWSGGRKEILREEPYQEYNTNFSATPSTPEKVRLAGTDTAGNQLFEFRPAPKDAKNYGYDYIRSLSPLSETSAGTVTIGADATLVTGHGSVFTEARTGDWLRVDALGIGQDSSWYRVSLITNGTTLTLNTAFANTLVESANYVISRAPEYPIKVQQAVLWGSLRALAMDQNDQTGAFYHIRFAEVMSDAKRLYATRTYSQKIETVAEDFKYRR